jgi:uncharacterized protein YybS (DUF2232 family)
VARDEAKGELMPRGKLSAIEIAEGALLADVAVVFQIIWMYVPVVGVFFRMLIPIVFTVLLLRRRLYAGIMSLCVALFLAAVVTGPNLVDLIYLLLEGVGGLYLGVTMKHRLRDGQIILLGATGLGVAIYGTIFVFALLFGTPLQVLVASLHQTYAHAVALAGTIAAQVGLSQFWTSQFLPLLTPLANQAFTYWWAWLFVFHWLAALPLMIVMYYITNVFVRLLGYDVRPFPGGRLRRLNRRLRRRLVRMGVRRGLVGRRARRRGARARRAQQAPREPTRERQEVGV